ncbi:MAG: AsmA family protein [Betaproteobacteria bacterium]|nr:AsmA family protein [Betaproteobacteria bacterium]
MKALKIAGIILGALSLSVVLVASAVYATAAFGKAFIEKGLAGMMLESHQRILKIDGDLSVSFRPGLSIKLGRVSLSERGSDKPFAAFDSAHVSVQLLPLLSRRVVFDRIQLDGAQASLLRRQDGTLNIDDLLTKDKSGTITYAVGEIRIANARLNLRDEMGDRRFTLTNLNLSAGPLAGAARGKLEFSAHLAASNPEIDSTLSLAADYDYDVEKRRFGLSRIDSRYAGLIGPAGEFGGVRNDIDARLVLTGIEAGPDALKIARLNLLLDARAGATSVKGTLSSALVADLSALTVRLPDFAGELVIAHPKMPMQQIKLPFSGRLDVDFAKLSAVGNVSAQFDESQVKAEFNLVKPAPSFAPLAPLLLNFMLDIDKLNVDRYLPPSQRGGGRIAVKGDAQKLGLPALKNLDVRGTVNIGALQFAGAKARNARLVFKSAGGALELGAAHAPRAPGRHLLQRESTPARTPAPATG